MARKNLNTGTTKLSGNLSNNKTSSTLEQGLFEPDQAENSARKKTGARKPALKPTVDLASQQCYLVTNHLNLLYFFAAGMIMSPAGFNGKHYADPSTSVPGWLPLFRGQIPEQALAGATQEFNYLRPCILEISLSSIRSQVLLPELDRALSKRLLPTEIDQSISTLFIRSPLLLSMITTVSFHSPNNLELASAARNSANTNISGLAFRVYPELFEVTSAEPWTTVAESNSGDLSVADTPPAYGQSVGGVLEMLYNIANRSSLCCKRVPRIAAGEANETDYLEISTDPALVQLPEWLNTHSVSGNVTEAIFVFYWNVVAELVDAKSKVNSSKPVDVVLACLSRSVSTVQDPALKMSTTTLLQDMRSTFGLGTGTISDLFHRHTEPLARALLLFCLRASCIDLLNFSHPAVRDVEYILASILFGIRDGWLGMPQELRASDLVAKFVENRMIEAEQLSRDEKLIQHSIAPRPVPLRELLISASARISASRTEALVNFVQSQGWEEAINTVIRLPDRLFNLNASPEGVEIIVKGNVPSVSTDIDLDAMLGRISVWPCEQENELRSILQIV